VINRKPRCLHNCLVESYTCINRKRIFACAANALILSAVCPICLEIEGAQAATTTTTRKHKLVKTGTPTVQKPAAAAQPTSPPAPVKAPPVAPVIERIRNQNLPLMFINERLIRDIMVGKPVETVPPSGTEAFSPEDAPAPAGLPATDDSAPKTPPSSSSTLAPDVMSTPNTEATPPAPTTPEPASQEKAKPADTTTDKQSTNSESAPVNAEAVSPISVPPPEDTAVPSPPAKAESTSLQPVPSESMAGAPTVGGEVFGDAVADQVTSETTSPAGAVNDQQDMLPLHGALGSAGQSANANQTTSPAPQEKTLDAAASQATPNTPEGNSTSDAKASAPRESTEFDSASTEKETIMDSAAAGR
jgi:hypothetical protein